METRTFIITATGRHGVRCQETIKIDGDSRMVQSVLNNYRALYSGMGMTVRIEEQGA